MTKDASRKEGHSGFDYIAERSLIAVTPLCVSGVRHDEALFQ
jgi:hypothetical protein